MASHHEVESAADVKDAKDPKLPDIARLFETVVARISSSSSSSSSSTTSIPTNTKLRLYGLYKYCTVGECPGNASRWSPTELSKQRAWQQICEEEGMTTKQAQLEYVRLAASLDDTCQTLLEDYYNNDSNSTKEAAESRNNNLVCDKGSQKQSTESIMMDNDAARTMTVEKVEKSATGGALSAIILEWCSLFWDVMASWIGFSHPVIPRGGLDIAWSDLWFALRACILTACWYSVAQRHQMEEKTQTAIETLWKEQASSVKDNSGKLNVQVVVGYSVRSLLDLYLMHKKFPPQASKEVIVVPPINIPGMVQILEQYGLVVVPVDIDIPAAGDEGMINLDAIQAAISERTVAILVVHPFGNASLSCDGFAKLRAMVNQQQPSIEIWEDAAESYRGVSDSTGSPHANVTFLSFGFIKTATALGGGVAILRNPASNSDKEGESNSLTAASAMRRLQNHHFTAQTTWQFAWRKVAKAMLVQTFSSNPSLYGCFVYLCLQWGGYDFLDQMVTQNLRSIVATASSNNEWMRSIRVRPCLPLLQLLSRRLAQTTQTSQAVRRRIQQCEEMTMLLQKHAPGIGQFPSAGNKSPDLVVTHWLYPIQVLVEPEKKRKIQKYLLQRGWDVTAGTSQLQCVQPTLEKQNGAPQKMQDLMAKVLYLPVASRSLSKQQSQELAVHLQQAIIATNDTKATIDEDDFSRGNAISKAKAVLPVLFILILSTGGYQSMRFTFCFILPKLLLLVVYGFIAMVFLACLVRWLGGSLYLELFSEFGRYSSMVDQICLDHDDTVINDSAPKQSPPSQSTDSNIGVIASMPSLDIPISASRSLPTDCSGCAILTGATGFVGSLILRDLLFHRKALNLTAGIFVVCRKKRSKHAQERIAELLEEDMFSFLSESERHDLVHVLEGDVTQPNAGLSNQDMNNLLSLAKQRKIITHIIHSAACVSFTQELHVAAQSNITSALNVQSLTVRLGQSIETIKDAPPPKFVYLSTAFVHGSMPGTKENPLEEQLFPLDPYDPQKLYESMLGTQFYASKAMNDLRFHNTYAFTKCVCEHLLARRNKDNDNTLIIRPSIVGPALESPTEGWAGQKPSTIVAAGCLYLSYQWNLWSFGNFDVPCIPVDILSRFVLKKSFDEETFKEVKDHGAAGATDATSSEDSFERVSSCSSLQSLSRCSSNGHGASDSVSECQMTRIHNATWNSSSASCAMFTWLDYCGATLQLGSVMGYFSRSTACFTLWITSRLLPRFGLKLKSYDLLHYYMVQAPVKMVVSLCHSCGWNGLESKLSKLSGFLDLPLLFFPYMNDTFHFKSSLSAPQTMNGSRYVFSCIVAAHRFLKKFNPRLGHGKSQRSQLGKTICNEQMNSFVIGGKQHKLPFNLWWALAQPKGSLVTRLAGWVFAMLLKATCHVLSIDLTSFESTLQKLHSLHCHEGPEEVFIILAPTHRSFFDFIILSYAMFVLPELGIDMPKIAAAEDFEDLPIIGYLAQLLGAFYIRRGRGRADPDLKTKLVELKRHGTRVFEVFLEGTRSRDRRFLDPRTGVLRSLADSGGLHLIVPVAISYEKVPEQDILAAEAVDQCGKRALNTGGLMDWLMSVLRGKVNLGRIHIAAGHPSMLDCKSPSEFKQLAKTIQVEQQRCSYSSNYHVRAAAKVLKMDPQLVRSALVGLGCRFTPSAAQETSRVVDLPDNSSEACSVMFQLSHELAKVCPSQPEWQRWFNHNCNDENKNDVFGSTPDVALFSRSLLSLLAAADGKVEKAYEALVATGFHQPNLKHLQQTAQKMCSDVDIPLILVNAAATMFHSKLNGVEHAENIDDTSSADVVYSNSTPQLLMESEERLGFWGFRDSGFFLQVGKNGSYGVSMRGRYAVSGRSLSKLLPFVEAETGVAIDPFNEAFKGTRQTSNEGFEDVFSKDDVGLLQSTVWKMTLSRPDRIRHGTGHSQEDIYAIRDECSDFRIPDAVVWPTSEEEIEALLSLAKEKCWCLIPFGGGTNVTQSTRCPSREVEPRPILSVDMTKLNRLLWLNEEDGLACFQAGVNGRDMVESLERRGYTMGHEPDSIEFSTLGGWIATKASGMKRNRYGNIEDIVRRVRVASSSGMAWQGGEVQNDAEQPVFGRESCGLDFQSIILGSEGCLGIITSAVVRVWPTPEVKEHESILFTSFSSGLRFVRDVAKLDRMIPASVRLLDNEHFRLGQALRGEPSSAKDRVLNIIRTVLVAGTSGKLDPRTVACATICYEGNKNEVQLQKAEMEQLAKDHGGILLGPQVGKAGYDMTFLIAYLRDFAMTYHFLGESFETFAPWSRVASIIERTKQRVKSEHEAKFLPGRPFVGCRVTQLYHEGACLYFYVCINTENVKNPSRVFSEIEHAARSEILQQGGSLSHHHGIGKLRAPFLQEAATPAFKRLVLSVKQSIDPDNIFAAGNGLFGE